MDRLRRQRRRHHIRVSRYRRKQQAHPGKGFRGDPARRLSPLAIFQYRQARLLQRALCGGRRCLRLQARDGPCGRQEECGRFVCEDRRRLQHERQLFVELLRADVPFRRSRTLCHGTSHGEYRQPRHQLRQGYRGVAVPCRVCAGQPGPPRGLHRLARSRQRTQGCAQMD